MITTFSVRLPKQQSGLRGLKNKIRRDKVQLNVERARGVTLRHITYTGFHGVVRLNRADRLIGEQRDRLVCSDKIAFPRQSGYRRFSSNDFSSRLCGNFSLAVLKACKKDVCVGLYDPTGEASGLMLSLLEVCPSVRAVTYNPELYDAVRQRAIDELGAAAIVTKNPSELSGCGLVIAPCRVEEKLPLADSAVLCTVGAPLLGCGGEVYGRYNFRMPNGFAQLKPEELDEEYFCSALYTLGGQYELGSIIPLSASSQAGCQTVNSMADLLDKQR